MRISTNTLYQTGISKISDITAQQSKLQQQLSSNTMMLTPSDNPVGAAEALKINQAQSLSTQYASNRTTAKNSLELEDSTLSSVSDLVISMQSSMIQAGDATLTNAQRSYIATQLTSSLQQLVSLANTKDGAGTYIFGGFNTSTAPYTQTATGATYSGDSGQRLVQVSSSRQMAVSDTGSSVFQSSSPDVFQTVTNLVNLLNTPVVTAADSAALTTGLATANTGLQNALNSVSTTQSSVGSRLKDLDSLDSFGQAQDLQYANSLSGLQTMDAAQQTQVISDLSQQQVVLQAAQKSFVSITSLSLFNFLN